MLLCPLLSHRQGTKLEESKALYMTLCVLSAALVLLYHTGLQTHPRVGVHFSVTGPSGAGYKTACNVIVKRFPWVVFSRNLSCLFSSRGSVTKTTPSRKAFLRVKAVFTMLISGKVIWEEGGSS